MNKIICILALIVLSGCSVTLPVRGEIGKGQERFLGTTTGYMDGTGVLLITTESGVRCKGEWQYVQRPIAGLGTFACQDGRTGGFDFTSDGPSGIGIGRTNKKEPFKFSYGQARTITTW